jgi:hypothetical protein
MERTLEEFDEVITEILLTYKIKEQAILREIAKDIRELKFKENSSDRL